MTYPDVPDLKPFKPCQRPNLMQSGQYDVTLDEIEKYLNDLGVYVDGQDDNLQKQITTLEGRVNTAESDIDNLETRMDTAESDIDNLETRMDTAESNINSIDRRVTTLEENPYILPEATPETLGGVYTVSDEDFVAYIGL